MGGTAEFGWGHDGPRGTGTGLGSCSPGIFRWEPLGIANFGSNIILMIRVEAGGRMKSFHNPGTSNDCQCSCIQ